MPSPALNSQLSSPAAPQAEPLLAGVWRADELGQQPAPTLPSGWSQLDAELPGGGWPTRSLTEVLAAQPALLEWRLLSPALRQVSARGGQIILVAPPREPFLPGLQQAGLDERQVVWIQVDKPADRLWVCEQLIKAGVGALVAWVPQARPEQVRRLQVCAQACEGLAFLLRPEAVQHDASAAPLRVRAGVSLDWSLWLQIVKRRGPQLDTRIELPSTPGGLAKIITPRLGRPSRLFHPEVANVVGRNVVSLPSRRHASVQ